MMKFLIITNHSYMLWRFRKELIMELQTRGEVVLSMPFVGHEDDFKGLGLRCIETNVDRRGINPIKDFDLLKTYIKMLKEERPDMVITYSIKSNIYAGLACRMLKIPFCANVQGLGTAFQKPLLAQVATMLYHVSLKKTKRVFFENEANALVFQNRKIMKKEKQTILHGAGINLEYYGLEPYPNHETVHFLYLGRIMKEKGISELFEAARRLHVEGFKFVLDLVGFFEDAYKEEVEQLQKEGIVVFHGFQEEPRPYYKEADCVVLPSYHEGMSNVLLEASAMGRPVITSNIPGCREAVENGKTGILCNEKDTNSLYQAMKQFLELSVEKRADMGVKAHEKMEREFDKKMIVEETIKSLGI